MESRPAKAAPSRESVACCSRHHPLPASSGRYHRQYQMIASMPLRCAPRPLSVATNCCLPGCPLPANRSLQHRLELVSAKYRPPSGQPRVPPNRSRPFRLGMVLGSHHSLQCLRARRPCSGNSGPQALPSACSDRVLSPRARGCRRSLDSCLAVLLRRIPRLQAEVLVSQARAWESLPASTDRSRDYKSRWSVRRVPLGRGS